MKAPDFNAGFFLSFQPHWTSQVIRTGYDEFIHKSGCVGLARLTPTQLEILAVHATKPGTGQFRAFIESAKERFGQITFWNLMNPKLEQTLSRYGFVLCTGMDLVWPTGEKTIKDGMRWTRG